MGGETFQCFVRVQKGENASSLLEGGNARDALGSPENSLSDTE